MTMNSRWRSLFFSFTNAPATGFPDASCTTPSTFELFSAAHADWPQRNSNTAVKMTANFDRVPLNFIPDLLIFLSLCTCEGPATNAAPARMCETRDIQNVCLDLTIRGVYANSVSAHSRFLNGHLRDVTGDRWLVTGEK